MFQNTLGLNDFYFGGTDEGWPLGNIQMVGKCNGWAMKGEAPKLTKLAPHWSLDDVAAPRRRLLVDDRGPSRPRQPCDRRR